MAKPVQGRDGRTTPVVLVVGARGIPDVEGGAEKNAEMLFPQIAAAGYRVVLVGLEGLIKSSSHRGVELLSAPNRRILNTDKLYYYLDAIRVARRMRPDIVHLQGLGASLFLWAYKLLGAHVVVRYGSADYTVDKWGVIGRLGFLAAEWQTRFADAVIAVAPALVQRLAERGIRGNVHLVANAVDDPPAGGAAARDPELGDAPYVLAVGRVTAQKAVDHIVAAFARFKAETGAPHRLAIAGGLEDRAYVDALRPRLGQDVVLLGRCSRDRLERLYQNCALYVNASRHEGSSNAVLEAISRDCPLLLSGIPENRDFGLAGYIYVTPDDDEALAAAMAAALAAPDRYRVDRSQFMTWRTVGEKTISIYRAILGRHG